MNRFLVFFFCCASLLASASAQGFRVAKVDVEKVFNEWQYAQKIKKELSEKTREFQEANNARLSVLRAKEMEIQEMRARFSRIKAEITEEEKNKMGREYRMVNRQRVALELDRKVFVKNAMRRMRHVISLRAQRLLDHIVSVSRVCAKEQGYSMLIESEGESSQNVPFFLYVDQADDLTPLIIDKLNAAGGLTP